MAHHLTEYHGYKGGHKMKRKGKKRSTHHAPPHGHMPHHSKHPPIDGSHHMGTPHAGVRQMGSLHGRDHMIHQTHHEENGFHGMEHGFSPEHEYEEGPHSLGMGKNECSVD